MNTYRIYKTQDITTVKTDSALVVMHLDADQRLRCINTGETVEQIAADTFHGRLGDTNTDEQQRSYRELFSE